MHNFNQNKKIKVHFIGIGGIGMSGIAEVLLELGYQVSGSDLSDSSNVAKLKDKGAEIYIGHHRENISNCTTVVYSSAIDETNPEIVEAKQKKIPLMRRAEMLAELMRLKQGLAIAGTHGKTTTTSFLATILQESKYEPTYIIGGIVDNLNGHAKVGQGQYLVAEADESDGSFLLLNPVMCVITNLDYDHMDFYKTKDNLHDAFEQFMNKIPFYGLCALNAHDEKLQNLIGNMKKPWVTFGTDTLKSFGEVDFQAKNIVPREFNTEFDLYYKGEFAEKIVLSLPGMHNVLNSLGAICLAHSMGISFQEIANSITKFRGVNRRFQLLYNTENFEVLDDYGHHPTEVRETLNTLKTLRPDRKRIAIFEPHRYTRTQECWEDFINSFSDVDEVYLLPIYAASEKEITGIDSQKLCEDINLKYPNKAFYLNSWDRACKKLAELENENVTAITLGAGSIGKMVRSWVAGK